MVALNKPCRVVLLYLPLIILFFLSGCNEAGSAISASVSIHAPINPLARKFDLSAQQGLRDLTGEFSVRASGADTGILLLPGEKVEIFASGSASVLPDGKQSGPAGMAACREPSMPEPSLACYSVIYSVGINGRADEVGAHVGFNPAAAGNLFLGINTPHLTSNTGAFHMTVLVIPSGTFTGMWITPESGFSAQGATMRLSAYVFAQDASIDEIQFTLALPGQAPVSICEAFRRGDGIYTCDWDEMLNGTLFPNGPVSLGFTLNGNTANGAARAPLVNPDGVRSGVVTYVETQPTSNYAGYAATNLIKAGTYQKVTGHWTVPTVLCSPGETSAASIWVGMTNDRSDQSLLAQLGTDSDCQDGSPLYYIWWEMYPAIAVPLDLPLQPGDTATATVAFQHGAFHLSIDVPNEGIHFSTTQAGKVSDTSVAECIVEAPMFVDDAATGKGHLAQLTRFGQVSIRCQLNGNEPVADGPQDIRYQMQTNTGTTKAATSALDRTGATFMVQWHHS